MSRHIADEHADLGAGNRRDAEEIAADGFGGFVAVDKLERAVLRRRVRRKIRILLRQHRQLDFARRPQVFFHERIFGAQFLTAAREFAGRASDLFLGTFALGDVLDRAFVVKQFSLAVTDGAAVFGNPDDGAVLAVNLRLEPRSEEHTSELQSRQYLVCRLLLEKKNKRYTVMAELQCDTWLDMTCSGAVSS